jgi:serine/threonine-protein kinase
MAEKMPMDLLPAETIGKFQLIAELGHGAMADVFLAVGLGPVGFRKLRVLKVLRRMHAEVPEVLGLFLDEARLAARLNHPNVVQTSEVCHEDDRVYLVMEYLEGQTLERVLRRARRHGGLPLGLHLRILADALGGLHHAHELTDFDGTPLRVVHRGVTPENLFITYEGQIKVVDFGIAKAATASVETQGGALKGKVSHMAPEQAMGLLVDRRADLFAVGILLWEAATGEKFWGERSEIQVLHHLSQGVLPPLDAPRPEVSPALLAICRKALAADPADRYATAAEIQADLEAILQAEPRLISARDAGEKVAELFADKRAAVRNLIEQQLNGLRITERGGSVLVGTRTGQSGTFAGLHEPSTVGHERRGSHSTMPVEGERPSGSSTVLAVGAMAGGFVVLVVLAIRALTSPVDRGNTLAQSAVGLSPEVSAHLQASPPGAHLFLDEVSLTRNPFEGHLPRDGALHRLLVTAPGHQPHSALVSFADDLALDIVLPPLAAAPEAATSASSGPHAPPPGIAPAPRAAGHGAAASPALTATPVASASAAPAAPLTAASAAPGDPPADLVVPQRRPAAGVRRLDGEDPWAAPAGSAAPGP